MCKKAAVVAFACCRVVACREIFFMKVSLLCDSGFSMPPLALRPPPPPVDANAHEDHDGGSSRGGSGIRDRESGSRT